MKKLYFLFFLAFSLFTNAQIVNIPDAVFKAKLLQSSTTNSIAQGTGFVNIKIDVNNNGEIEVSEVLNVKYLNVSYSSISNLQGIESFSNLVQLFCSNNSLVSLNVSTLNDLFYLDCKYNTLGSLILPSVSTLQYIYCSHNNLINLDVSIHNSLLRLECYSNSLTNLTLNYHPLLFSLKCQNNQISYLNLSGSNDLIELDCSNNSITQLINSNPLIVTNWDRLKSYNCSNNNISDLELLLPLTSSYNDDFIFDCSNNQISNLNIQGFYKAKKINCENNQINNLNVVNNTVLTELICNNNLLTNIDSNILNNLNVLNCSNNIISTLDFSGNVDLIRLICNDNLLINLNISNKPLLYSIDCSNNNIVNLTLNNNPVFKILNCSHNQLSLLDFTQNIQLNSLNCSFNQITFLDVTQYLNLNYLNCSNIMINDLNLNNNTALAYLDCSFNNLNELDLNNNTFLEILNCNTNLISDLNLLNNLYIYELNCENNLFTDLDLSNHNIDYLNCSNNLNLQNLYIKNDYYENDYDYETEVYFPVFSFENNYNLRYICADEFQLEDIQNSINSYGYTNCHVNTYCSFIPGGTFYEISGNTKFDFDNNGCDVSDINYSNLNFSIANSTNSGTMIANQTGNYYIPVEYGLHTITPVLESPTYFNINPTSFVANFPTQASPFTQDFCVTANGVKSDVEVMVLSTVPARPGFDTTYKILYRNKGNQVENGNVSLTFDDAELDYVSSNPSFDSSAANSYTWNYTNLQPFETREIEVVFNVNGPTETPAVNNGDVLNYTTTISTSNTDETPNDNTFTLDQTVVGSYDPNDKTCLEGETVEPSMIGEYVHYIIRFENTGTFPAENIVVKDMIDLAKFDIATLIPLKGSHDYFTRIKDNKVEFIFENINLDFNDATNDGYVAFKIKTKSTLVVGNTFSNNANIYFDYNFPITTNTYTTTITALSNQSFEFGSQFTLYPNPAKEVLNIQSKNSLAIQSVEIYNLLGQVVLAVPNTTNAIDVSNLKTSTYFVKVNTEKGSSNTKFVKE